MNRFLAQALADEKLEIAQIALNGNTLILAKQIEISWSLFFGYDFTGVLSNQQLSWDEVVKYAYGYNGNRYTMPPALHAHSTLGDYVAVNNYLDDFYTVYTRIIYDENLKGKGQALINHYDPPAPDILSDIFKNNAGQWCYTYDCIISGFPISSLAI